jgi:iron complex outermembrane receptor protein
VPIAPISGKFNTKEVFAEANADIISPSNDITGIYRLDLQAAARYVDNSISGGDTTWTVGGRYAPIRDISFRGNFTHAIRSPSIQEAFIPTSTFFSFAEDPCDQGNLGNGPDPATRAANCAADGIIQPFDSFSDDASFLQGTGGNPNLANEVSDAFSVGAVLTPRFIPGLTVSGDYIKVTLNDAIANFTADQVLNACYDSTDFPANEFCDRFTRDPDGQLSFVSTSFFNAARLRYRGLVFAWDWKMKTPFLGSRSSLGLSGSYQHLLELSTVNTAGSEPVDNDGTLGYPKNSWTATANYLNGPWSFFVNLNYTGKVDQGVEEADDFRENQRLKAFVSTNAGFSVNVAERFRFFADVDNIFDVKPPYPVPAFGGSVTYFPGVIGRYFRFGAGVSF